MSRPELAELAGVSRPFMSMLERDLREAKFDTVERFAKAFEIPPLFIYVLAVEQSKTERFATVVYDTKKTVKYLLDIKESK